MRFPGNLRGAERSQIASERASLAVVDHREETIVHVETVHGDIYDPGPIGVTGPPP